MQGNMVYLFSGMANQPLLSIRRQAPLLAALNSTNNIENFSIDSRILFRQKITRRSLN